MMPRTIAWTRRLNPSRLAMAAPSAPTAMKAAKKATVMTSAIAKTTATITQNQKAAIRGTFYGLRDARGRGSGGFCLQASARVPLDGDRHNARALDNLQYSDQPDLLASGRKVDADHRHGGVTVRAAGRAHRLCGIPGALSARAAAAADQIEDHPFVGRHGRAFPTSLHVMYNASRHRHLAARNAGQALSTRRQRDG